MINDEGPSEKKGKASNPSLEDILRGAMQVNAKKVKAIEAEEKAARKAKRKK